jgi:hypothetical protein
MAGRVKPMNHQPSKMQQRMNNLDVWSNNLRRLTREWLLLTSTAFCCLTMLIVANVHAESLTDPTRPIDAKVIATAASNAPAALRVEAIFHAGTTQRPLAIINGKLVHEGERVANALIEQITSDAVRYSRAGHSQLALLNAAKLQVRRTTTTTTQLVARADDHVGEQP